MTWLTVAFSWIMVSLILAPVLGHFLSMVEEHTDPSSVSTTQPRVLQATHRSASSVPEPADSQDPRWVA